MQLTELRQYAGARGWSITEEYVDKGWSGKTRDRPALKACMAAAAKHAFDAILVWKLDRWGRTVAQLSADILTLDSAGVRFVCPSQSIDTDQSNPMSRLLINILAAFAQFERDVIEERVTAGLAQYKRDYKAGRIGSTKHSKSGKDLPPGRPRRVFNRQLVRNRREAGESWNAIAAELGIPKSTLREAV